MVKNFPLLIKKAEYGMKAQKLLWGIKIWNIRKDPKHCISGQRKACTPRNLFFKQIIPQRPNSPHR